MPVPLQTLAQVLEQPRVLLVPRVRIRYLRTCLRVRIVPPLPTPQLSTAPMVPTKQLQPVMPDTMELLVMPLAKRVLLVLIQIPERAPGQHRVVTAPLVFIRCLRT